MLTQKLIKSIKFNPKFSCASPLRRYFDGIIDIDDKSEILMQPLDYPENFRGHEPGTKLYAHPDDYQKETKPITPEFFLFRGPNGRGRLFLRASFKISKETKPSMFTSATFFVDSGACPELTVCEDLYKLLEPRIVQHFRYDFIHTEINGKKLKFQVSTSLDAKHKPANLMGLPVFFALGLKFHTAAVDELEHDKLRIVRDIGTLEPFDFL